MSRGIRWTEQKWLTIEELAEYLKMGRTKLYRMAQDGEIPASKVGNQWRFDAKELDKWLKSGKLTSLWEPR
ncbi:MAG TPA: helix-turn-helix domain-containing protein [Anaerohalosphaeraceae bacterium]|nr:helix-turn-helix domain-containing protein [Anaerohalosphaeraceae bacterium]